MFKEINRLRIAVSYSHKSYEYEANSLQVTAHDPVLSHTMQRGQFGQSRQNAIRSLQSLK